MVDDDTDESDATTIEMCADFYDGEAKVATDGRLWLGEDWADETVEVAVRRTQ